LKIACATPQNLTISSDSFVFCDGTKSRTLYFKTPGQTQHLQITAIPSCSGQSSGTAPYSLTCNGKRGKKNFEVKRKVYAKGTCSSTGDPHITTFDGVKFNIQQAGYYTMVDSQFLKIQTHHYVCNNNNPAAPIYCQDGVAVQYKTDNFIAATGTLNKRNITMFNSSYILVNPKDASYKLNYMNIVVTGSNFVISIADYSNYAKITLTIGANVNVDDITLSANHAGKTKGTCGNFNGNKTDDYPSQKYCPNLPKGGSGVAGSICEQSIGNSTRTPVGNNLFYACKVIKPNATLLTQAELDSISSSTCYMSAPANSCDELYSTDSFFLGMKRSLPDDASDVSRRSPIELDVPEMSFYQDGDNSALVRRQDGDEPILVNVQEAMKICDNNLKDLLACKAFLPDGFIMGITDDCYFDVDQMDLIEFAQTYYDMGKSKCFLEMQHFAMNNVTFVAANSALKKRGLLRARQFSIDFDPQVQAANAQQQFLASQVTVVAEKFNFTIGDDDSKATFW